MKQKIIMLFNNPFFLPSLNLIQYQDKNSITETDTQIKIYDVYNTL